MKMMKKNIALLLSTAVITGALALTGCGSSNTEKSTPEAPGKEVSQEATPNPSDTAPEQKAPAETPVNALNGKTVKVGCSATFVPFESITMKSDGTKDHVGMDIDMIRAIVEKNGGKVEFQDMPFKSLMAAIQANQIDFCIGGMTPTEERQKTLDFSEIYFYPRNAIIYKEGADYPTLDSLKGKTVAYAFGTNYQQVAESIPDAKTVGIQGSPACIEEVKSGRADACIIDGAGAVEFLKNNPGLKLSLLDKTDDCFAIGFPKESPYYEIVNTTLKEMMENGELDAIIKTHLTEEFILD